MNGVNIKGRTNWLNATALAGGLGVVLLTCIAPEPTLAKSLYLSGGGGGGGTQNGIGGSGSGALIDSQKPKTINRGENGAGAAGGMGGIGGSGKVKGQDNSSSEVVSVPDDDAVLPPDDTVTSSIGDGITDMEKSGNGGKGGDVTVNVTKAATFENIVLEGGNGGESGHAEEGATGKIGVGGQGGDAKLNGSGQTITFNNNLSLTSGKVGDTETVKSDGGKVAFSAGTLVVGEGKDTTINLTRNDGDLMFKTEQLDASKGDVTISLNNTQAWTNNNDKGVTFGDMMIGMGHQVTIKGDGHYGVGSITVGQPGQVDLTPAKFSTDTDLKMDSKSKLVFYLPEEVQNGASLIRNTGKGNIIVDDVQVDLRLAGTDLKNLKAGDNVRLIEGQVVGKTATTEQTLSYGAKNWNFDIATENANLTASLKAPKVEPPVPNDTNKGETDANQKPIMPPADDKEENNASSGETNTDKEADNNPSGDNALNDPANNADANSNAKPAGDNALAQNTPVNNAGSDNNAKPASDSAPAENTPANNADANSDAKPASDSAPAQNTPVNNADANSNAKPASDNAPAQNTPANNADANSNAKPASDNAPAQNASGDNASNQKTPSKDDANKSEAKGDTNKNTGTPASNNNGSTNSIVGKDDGKGNIYTDDYGAITINRAKANAYFQSNAAALNALNYGADQVSTIDDYVLPMDPKQTNQPVEGVVFLQGSGFNQKVETGSHIRNNGYHIMGGGGVRLHQDQGNLLITAFVEHGDGDLRTRHEGMHGKGDFSYTGVGLYSKQTWDNGWFVDGSGRIGRVKRDFRSSSMVDGGFNDKSSNYYGFHIGGGKEIELSPDDKVTIRGKLLWTEIGDFSTTSKADERLHFDSARSVRTHVGTQIDHRVTSEVKVYAGAAWEQELDGEVKGKLDGYRVDKPDFSGASAVFEVGGKYEQIPGMQGWVANAGLKGVAGTRQEFSGKLGVGYRW